ncbi:MAG: hypothetical protein J2P18_08930 [Nocardia sp.]|nr:hypothetical protein [Nocardia sp.]
MTAAIVPAGQLSMVICRTPEELAHAARFRHELFRSRSNLSFDENAERRRDEDAILVNLVLRDGIPVSTARCVPYPSHTSPLTGVIDSRTYGADSEVGRIAAVAAPESAVYALLALTLGALWVLENSDRKTYISYVHPKLVAAYLPVGAVDTGTDCEIPNRSVVYRIVVGAYEDCVQRGLDLLGFTESQARAVIGRQSAPSGSAQPHCPRIIQHRTRRPHHVADDRPPNPQRRVCDPSPIHRH